MSSIPCPLCGISISYDGTRESPYSNSRKNGALRDHLIATHKRTIKEADELLNLQPESISLQGNDISP